MTRRRNFSPSIKRAAFNRSRGICECHRVRQLPTYRVGCGRSLGEGNTFYEHIEPDGAGGSNDLENCAAICRTCWKAKTKWDRPTVARVVARLKSSAGIKAKVSRPMPGGRNSPFKITIGRGVVWRDSGRRVGGDRR